MGAAIYEDATFHQFIDEHVSAKSKNVLKFHSFLSKNKDLPYTIKYRVFEACLLSSILYSSETWLHDRYGKLNTLYMGLVKALLGVKESCPNNIALLEGGFCGLQGIIRERQFRFYSKLVNNRSHMTDDPFIHMLSIARENSSPRARYIDSLLKATDVSFIKSDSEARKEHVRHSAGSKFITYRLLNTELIRHHIYDDYSIPEFKRICFTRFRTSCHHLKIETGRWSRIARERRLCSCDSNEIQDEVHVIEACSHLTNLRASFPGITFTVQGFFEGSVGDIASFVHQAMDLLEQI